MSERLRDKCRVSVIVPVFRGMGELEHCLACLAAQTLPADSVEIIVVDNGSNPGIQSLLAQYPSFTLLEEKQPGSYAARNTGLAHAHGEIVAFTDADCQPDPDWLEAGLERLYKDREADLIGGRVRLIFATGDARTLTERYERLTAFPQQRYVEELDFAVTANLFVRRGVLDELNGFEASLQSGGDRDFGQRAKAAGFRLVYEETAVVAHPSRANMKELLVKARRVAHGEMAMWRQGKVQNDWRYWFNLLMPPLVWAYRLLRDRSKPWGLGDRLSLIIVQHIIYLVVLPVRLGAVIRGRDRPLTGDSQTMNRKDS